MIPLSVLRPRASPPRFPIDPASRTRRRAATVVVASLAMALLLIAGNSGTARADACPTGIDTVATPWTSHTPAAHCGITEGRIARN